MRVLGEDVRVLVPLRDTVNAYQRFAEDYYEVPVNLAAVRHMYALRPLTPALVSSLNAATGLSDVAEEIGGIGYPRVQRNSA